MTSIPAEVSRRTVPNVPNYRPPNNACLDDDNPDLTEGTIDLEGQDQSDPRGVHMWSDDQYDHAYLQIVLPPIGEYDPYSVVRPSRQVRQNGK